MTIAVFVGINVMYHVPPTYFFTTPTFAIIRSVGAPEFPISTLIMIVGIALQVCSVHYDFTFFLCQRLKVKGSGFAETSIDNATN
jgi:hypothetical protein